tara:strand:- start:27660 stop:29045 length:1386 start_codon:yes stop_codon:yes gene_type:complete
MILVGNQRGGAKDLALHLLKEENDHVQVHELRGFASDNLTSALNESYAISRATRCKQFLYSMSLNPPPDHQVSTEAFEAAIDRAEERLGLSGQPRAIVFHEKEGRRHAHCVWSRIKTDEMKAVHMSKDREKLMEVSRDLYREHGWKMPRGMMKSAERDPRNFSLEEWQQAKRAKADPREVKMAIKECWAVSDSRAAFENALQSRGFKLARGDRRGFVVVDMNGEPFAIARWAEIKTKEVRARLGDLEPDYPGVEDRKQQFAQEIGTRLRNLRNEEARKAEEERERAESAKRSLIQSQAQERAKQAAAIKLRWDRENADRQARFNRGWRALVDQFSGRLKRIREQNMEEAYRCMLRDRVEKDALIFSHLEERRELSKRYKAQQRQRSEYRAELDADINRYPVIDRSQSAKPKTQFQQASRAPPDPKRRSGDQDADRMAKREAFKARRLAQARNRGPRHDLDR